MSARNPDHYAIVVGIDTYPKLPRLRASVSDATRFMEWLMSPDGGGLDKNHIFPIVSPDTLSSADPLDAIPAQRHVSMALRSLGITNNKRIGQRLYFYFAGHGFGPGFDDVGMLLADAWEPHHLVSNIGLRPYRLFFRDFPLFDELVFILDCCRDQRRAQTKGPELQPDAPVAGGKPNDFVVMGAVYGEQAFQVVQGDTKERRGLLTKAVLEGLEGAAADGAGRVTTATLSEYVKKRVPQLAGDASVDEKLAQVPDILPPAADAELVITTIPAGRLQRVLVKIVAPQHLQGDLVLCEGAARREIERHAVAAATQAQPWETSLVRNRAYEVKHAATGITQPLDTSAIGAEPYVFRFLQGA